MLTRVAERSGQPLARWHTPVTSPERTVESHVRSILAKLGNANRAELIAARR